MGRNITGPFAGLCQSREVKVKWRNGKSGTFGISFTHSGHKMLIRFCLAPDFFALETGARKGEQLYLAPASLPGNLTSGG